LLREGRHGIDLIPASRWDRERTFDSDTEKPGKINTRHGGFLEGIDLFDNDFFGVTAEEARQMDPQQRIMLELTYEAFEDAGLSPARLEGSDVGVFVGVMSNDYLRHQTSSEFLHIDRHTGSGSGYCMIANRISYQFNLRGPSMAIDSACSSSLVSTFMACESLWTNQCSLALAAGVNLILSPAISVFYTRGGLSAPDGKCRTFSDDATGMGRGEGAGIVVLKRLSCAVRDGDNIYAVIRGGSINHNGRGNGMSAPNRWAQQQLLRKAYEHAGITPGELQYVELHGTGTLIGDAIEATALGSVLAEDRRVDQPCMVGSVKTNLGHLEGAAGVAGLIKLALCLNHAQLVPSLWFNAPNPHVAFDTLPIKVQDRLQPWPDSGKERLGAISSFGLGGANAHLVLQSAPGMSVAPMPGVGVERFILQLSARSAGALAQMAGRYSDCMKKLAFGDFSALCHTTQVRPSGHDYRATFVARTQDEMIGQISALAAGMTSPNTFTGRYRELPRRKVIFVFPEFGVIDLASVRSLAKAHPRFRQSLAECDAAIQEVLRHPIAPLMAQLDAGSTSCNDFALPFVHLSVQIALARLWRAAGLQPDAVAGIGMGQIAARMAAGAIDMKTAVAHVADSNSLGLTKSGTEHLPRNGPFLLDCYSPCGKNLPPESLKLLDTGLHACDLLAIIPDLARRKEVDYILLGQDVNSNDPHYRMTTAFDAGSFDLELARLSIRHNIQWKDFVCPQALIRSPRYPWQHTRHWLNIPHDAGFAGVDHEQEVADSSPSKPAEDHHQESRRQIALDHPLVSSLDRETLLNLPEQERRATLAIYLKKQVAAALHISADDLEEPQTFTGLGIDSLTAFQLKNRVESDLKVPVSLVKLLDGHSIGDLATDLLSEGLESSAPLADDSLVHHAVSGFGEDRKLTPAPDIHAQIEAMPPELIDEMLRQLLSAISFRS
jgi:acyl transferase domain-containing protein